MHDRNFHKIITDEFILEGEKLIPISHLYTNSMEFIKLVTNKLTIQKIIVDREKLSKDLINFAFWNDISLLYYDELKLQGFLLNEYDLALTFGFGHKFSLQEIEAYRRGIWNFHPGKLPIYRGRHPISHAMINGDKNIFMSIHKIDEHIDRGLLIAEGFVKRDFDDNQELILKKLFQLVDNQLLDLAMQNYSNNVFRNISEGTYQKPIFDGIEFNGTEHLTCDYIYNSVKSQETFGGIRYKGKVYSQANYIFNDHYNIQEGIILNCLDGLIQLLP